MDMTLPTATRGVTGKNPRKRKGGTRGKIQLLGQVAGKTAQLQELFITGLAPGEIPAPVGPGDSARRGRGIDSTGIGG